jgi:S-adenosylmethionine:tRNA ribosyltransferase-isomerase
LSISLKPSSSYTPIVTPRPSYPISRLDYELPPELIAQQPPPSRGQSRMLVVDVSAQSLADCAFAQLLDHLRPQTLIVLNDSRVIPARLFASRASGGRVEIVFTRALGEGRIEALVGSRGKLAPGEMLLLPGGWRAELLSDKSLDGCELHLSRGEAMARPVDAAGQGTATPLQETDALSVAEIHAYLDAHGEPPLPPYIKRPDGTAPADRERYQTVYAAEPGSSAAPTAGLHFTPEMLAALESAGHTLLRVTLHVGLGTFAPLRADDLARHEMHAEAFSVATEDARTYLDAIAAGRPVLAVGTTSLRVLHTLLGLSHDLPGFVDSLLAPGQCIGETRAFIYPGQGTEAATHLLTNFHLPRSTLLALVYAFGGEDLLLRAYRRAIEQSYRFFSYGDCMLIRR